MLKKAPTIPLISKPTTGELGGGGETVVAAEFGHHRVVNAFYRRYPVNRVSSVLSGRILSLSDLLHCNIPAVRGSQIQGVLAKTATKTPVRVCVLSCPLQIGGQTNWSRTNMRKRPWMNESYCKTTGTPWTRVARKITLTKCKSYEPLPSRFSRLVSRGGNLQLFGTEDPAGG